MEIDRLETHDRYMQFLEQSNNISECCQNLIDQKPFGNVSFYIFAHQRTLDIDEKYKLFLSGVYSTIEEVPTNRMIWQPRLTKPKAQTNSMLFKVSPDSDNVKIIWILPVRELWPQFEGEKMTSSNVVAKSIFDFTYNRIKLEEREEDDLTDMQIDAIYKQLSKEAQRKKAIEGKKNPLTCPPCS